MKIVITLLSLCLSLGVYAQDKLSYQLFNAKGKRVSYKKLIKTSAKQDIVLFGELHNNAISHWLELELSKDLKQQRNLLLGAEMFEADNQEALDAYLKGYIDAKGLDSTARLWPNYSTDYAPLVDFAKNEGLPIIATNIPRRYANKVYREGFEALDTLSLLEKSWIAPLPFPFNPELPRYQEILSMMGDHGTPELVMAQASKDATMAHFIMRHFSDGHLFLHYNGAFHSDFHEGILWYLQQNNPNLNYLTISTVEQSQLRKLDPEHLKRADFIIVVDEDVTKTY